ERFLASEIGFCGRLVSAQVEEEGDVDVDPLTDQLPDGGHALGGAGNLDHQVRTAHGAPEAPPLGDRALRVARQVGGDLQADVAVAALRLVVDRAADVGGGADVVD